MLVFIFRKMLAAGVAALGNDINERPLSHHTTRDNILVQSELRCSGQLCHCEASSVSQQVISRGTDGSAAAAAPWPRTRTSRHSACCPPPLLCRAQSPLIPPCLPFYRTEGSGNLTAGNKSTQIHTRTQTARQVFTQART